MTAIALAFSTLSPPRGRLLAAVTVLVVVLAAALASALYMEENGHWVTGMTNTVVWGMPHVFAIFLIVAASGALNVASMASVFGKAEYKPLAPLSGLLAVALLAGGLAVLVLDLGRPDRLIIAMLHNNPRSIFAWNVVLYTGFMAVVGVYLWTMMVRRRNAHTRAAGTVAFVWRLVLTTGTGSIFGFLVAREAYHSAVMAPMFVAMSLAFGTAAFMLVLALLGALDDRPPGDLLLRRLGRLLALLVAVQLYFIALFHLTNLYAANGRALERFLLLDGGIYTRLFWSGAVVVGGIVPMVLGFFTRGRAALLAAAAAVVAGGLMLVYVLVIGGQAYPMPLLPGLVAQSTYRDGVVAQYAPTLPEALLGLGGVAIALLIVVAGCAVLRFLPRRMPD